MIVDGGSIILDVRGWYYMVDNMVLDGGKHDTRCLRKFQGSIRYWTDGGNIVRGVEDMVLDVFKKALDGEGNTMYGSVNITGWWWFRY